MKRKENKENSTNMEIKNVLKEVCSMKIKLEEMKEILEEKGKVEELKKRVEEVEKKMEKNENEGSCIIM